MNAAKFHHAGPHLPVRNLQETLIYYREQLGFYDAWTFGERDGGIRRDDMRLLFGEDAEFATVMNTQAHRLPILWFVENIPSIYSEFCSRGVEIVDALREHAYGLKEFAFIDVNGYYIRVAEKTDEQ